MKVTFKTKGFAELERALAEELPKATARNVLRRAGLKAMAAVESTAKNLAPKGSGDLAILIETKPVKAKRISRTRYARSEGVEIATGPTVNRKTRRQEGGYAAWQEFGTVNMPANPYMRPAADAQRTAVPDEVGLELAEQIEKAKKRIARKTARAAKA